MQLVSHKKLSHLQRYLAAVSSSTVLRESLLPKLSRRHRSKPQLPRTTNNAQLTPQHHHSPNSRSKLPTFYYGGLVDCEQAPARGAHNLTSDPFA